MRSGWNASKSESFSPTLANMIGTPDHGSHREGGTAARVAVELREHDTGERQALVEGGGDVHRFLPGHAVEDEQRLFRLGATSRSASISAIISSSTCSRPAVSRISVSHSLSTRDVAARGATERGRRSRLVPRARPGRRSVARESRAGPSPRAGTRRDRPASGLRPRLRSMAASLARKRRLARPLQPHHHHDAGRPLEVERRDGPAEKRGQLLVHDPNDLLLGGEALVDFFPDQARLDPRDEVLDHAEVDVRFEQRATHFAHGLANVVFGELSARTDRPRTRVRIFPSGSGT